MRCSPHSFPRRVPPTARLLHLQHKLFRCFSLITRKLVILRCNSNLQNIHHMVRLFQNSRTARILFILIGIAVVYIAWNIAPIIYKPLHISNVSLRLALRGIISFIPMTAILLCLHKPSDIITSIGLNANILKGLGFAALCCSPLLIGMPVIGSFNTDLTFDYFF